MVSMLCDHANFLVIRRGVFAPYTAADGSILIPADAPAGVLLVQRVYGIFEILGHIGFPIFIFLLTEGFLHTRSRKRYLLTLAAFAVLALYSGQRGGGAGNTFSMRSTPPTFWYCCGLENGSPPSRSENFYIFSK